MTLKQIGAAVAALVILGAIYGAYQYPKVQELVGSPAGSTFNTAKTAMIVWSPTTASATSTSLYNGDSSDRIIKQAQYYCSGLTNAFDQTGAGVAALTFVAATTSTNAPALITNTNYVLNTTVATSAALLYVASTTPGLATSPYVRVWGAGTYLTFTANATSSTQGCVIGVDYLAS